ncbi:DUF5689 domain-containing protein [Aegicerativicinus sediminis]|uniref:DUF5689 domain-containing protein n=1 Tax=Aegicerativicinus sediminis TaxID=2893202 RepID=UPI001E515612|nr:DUF5689 domain-containing protein [Aegicerativicinus sediminis]
MRTHYFIQLVIYFTISITIMSCSTEELVNHGPSTKVSFANQTHTIAQDMESISIPLKLEPKANNNGFITIELSGNATYGTDFTTIPEAVNNKFYIKLLTNTQDTSFVITRANVTTTEKLINLKLSNPTADFSLGSRITSEVKLNAQPNPSFENKLNFAGSAGTVSEENTQGMTIALNTTTVVSNGTSAKVKITAPQGIAYGTHFSTIPSAILNEVSLEFNQNAQGASFKLIPINDNVFIGDYNIVFEIIEVSENLVIGENKTFTATVSDNDQPYGTLHTITELRAIYNEHQGDWYLSQDYFIEGVVTSNDNTMDSKSIYVQDATSGILIRFTTPNMFNLGDKIRLNLKNGTGMGMNGQKGINGVNISNVVKYAENIPVFPETITIAQLHTGNYEGKKVKIEGVHFVDADGIVKFIGSHTIRRDEAGAIVLVYSTATFSDYILTQGTLSVTGIVGDYGRLMPQKFTHDITN